MNLKSATKPFNVLIARTRPLITEFNVADIFGENVFNDTVMKERLPKNVYKNLKLAMTGVQELSLTDADVIANAMKDWAIEKGATHYTHWFQPLTGTTA